MFTSGARLAGPAHELVHPDGVGLHDPPREVLLARPLLHRPHAVLPVVPGDEVAPGIADEWDAELLHQVQDVPAEAIGVRRGVAGFEDAPVHGPSDMLDEGSEDPGVGPSDGELAVQCHARLERSCHGGLLRSKERPRRALPDARGHGHARATRRWKMR